MIRAMRTCITLLTVAVLLPGCAGQASNATASPSHKASPAASPATASSSPASTPAPVTGAFGLLVTPLAADSYTVSLIATNGKVVGSAKASSPTQVICGDGSAAVVPLPVSTSNSRAYFMDAQGVVRFLTPQGETGRATTVPIGGGQRSTFSVSPDDQRIAVVVTDYISGGVSIRLYVEDLNGATNHVDTFTSSGAFGLWPIGWHGTGNLVVAKVPACKLGSVPLCCGPLELHVVDPGTAVRRFTIGGPNCVIGGPPTSAGAVCETNAVDINVLDWTGALRWSRVFGNQGPAYLSINGEHIARSTDQGTTVLWMENTSPLRMRVCGWIDDAHLLSAGDAQTQPLVGDIATGSVVPVAAAGDCGGRIPGGL